MPLSLFEILFMTRFAGIRLALGLLAATAGLAAAPAEAADVLKVMMDQAKVLKLEKPVAKVIVGNANIADATVADARTIVLTGRSFGATNLVLLDAQGNTLADRRILVALDENDTLRVYSQTNRTLMSCSPNCEMYEPGTTGPAAVAN